MRIGAPFAIAALYAVTESDWLFWLMATIYLTAEVWFGQQKEPVPEASEPPESRLGLVALLMLCTLAALVTSGSVRPDADDAYFLNVATAAIEFPEAALQSFDALHGSDLPPVEQTIHLPQVYEILVSLLSSLTGVSVKVLYYIILPPFWAVLGTLAHWLVLHHFLRPREAIWGTAIFVLILIFWGDGHRTFGNFGFVRLFQGKAIYIMVVLPLVVLAALRFRQRPCIGAWLFLAFSQFAAAGLTANGVVIAPLAAVLAIVARPRFDARFLRTMSAGIAASLPLMVVAGAMYARLAPYLSGMNVDVVLISYTTTLGKVHTPLVLVALTLLPVLAGQARLKCADWIAGYVWIVIVVIFMPAASYLASLVIGPTFSWRLFWAVPVPLLVSLAGGIAAGAISKRRWWSAGALTVWVAMFATSGPAAVSSNIFSLENLGRLKVFEAPYAAAEEIINLARSDAPALVPEPVAIYMTGFPNKPPLVGVRALYLRKLRGLVPNEELASRVALFEYSTAVNPSMTVGEALKAIEVKGISTVSFSEDHRDVNELVYALRDRGFEVISVQGFVIATDPE